MAIKTQLFSPDTCGCRVYETWDDALPSDQVIYTFAGLEHRGDEHAAIVDASLYATIKEENHRKNKALVLCLTRATLLAGDPSRISWSFTVGRVLQLSFPGLNVSTSIKTQLQNDCDLQLGIGTCLVV